MKNKKGITLISLVITIIILLILAGVTLNMVLSNNGIFNMTKKATESYQIASEREYLEQNVLSVQLDKYMGNVSSEKLGDELKERNVENSYNWHIVKVKDSGKQYDTGWNYIEKGTELSGYGKAKNNWLVNYETGEVIQLEENNYTSILAGDMLAIKDNLIINIDSSIIDDEKENKSKEDIEKQLGKGVELHNFAEYGTAESGLTSTSFNFDGVDDYITIQYDKPEQKEALAKQGFTFEFYGKWLGGTSSNNYASEYRGIFCYWNGIEEQQARFRFGIAENGITTTHKELRWNAGFLAKDGMSDFGIDLSNLQNIFYELDLDRLRQGCYMTVTLDTSSSYAGNGEKYQNVNTNNIKNEEYYKQTIYLDGKILYQGDYNKKQWDNFISKDLNGLKLFCIGRSSQSKDGWWHYSKMNSYCLRLYSRALSESEVQKNYEKSVEYHSLLEK